MKLRLLMENEDAQRRAMEKLAAAFKQSQSSEETKETSNLEPQEVIDAEPEEPKKRKLSVKDFERQKEQIEHSKKYGYSWVALMTDIAPKVIEAHQKFKQSRASIDIYKNQYIKTVDKFEELKDELPEETRDAIFVIDDNVQSKFDNLKHYITLYQSHLNVADSLMEYVGYRKDKEYKYNNPALRKLSKDEKDIERLKRYTLLRGLIRLAEQAKSSRVWKFPISRTVLHDFNKVNIDVADGPWFDIVMKSAYALLDKMVVTDSRMIDQNKLNLGKLIQTKNKKLTKEEHKQEADVTKELSIQARYKAYEAWAYALPNTPDGLDSNMRYARRFPFAKNSYTPTVKNGMIVEGLEAVIQVARWNKPLAWTEGTPKDIRLPYKEATRIGWIIPMFMPGVLWYNLFSSRISYDRATEHRTKSKKARFKSWDEIAKQIVKSGNARREWLVKNFVPYAPFNYKSRGLIQNMMWAMGEYRNGRIHKSVYMFVIASLLGYSPADAVALADRYIFDDKESVKGENPASVGFWKSIINKLKFKWRINRNKPKIANVFRRLLDRAKDYVFANEVYGLYTAENKNHKNVIVERLKSKYNLYDHDIDILVNLFNDND